MSRTEALREQFRDISRKRTDAQIVSVARVKRFHERMTGDPLAREDHSRLAAHAACAGLPLEQLRPLWDTSLGLTLDAIGKADARRWPEVAEWTSWLEDQLQYRHALRELGSCAKANPQFDSWRRRQIVRLTTELPPATCGVQVYAPIAFELSEGCSVGCRFCGLSAGRLSRVFRYAEGARLWRDALEAVADQFGESAGAGICYWATDPFDNPDYLRFIDDVFTVVGLLPTTTTALALRKPEMSRRCMQLANERGSGAPRFSVLSQRQLDALHASFEPTALLNVTVVNQSKGSATVRAQAGRLFVRGAPVGEHATIAGVVGFVANMSSRTIRMVLPCLPTETWPDGFRVLGSEGFEDGPSFGEALKKLQAAHCPAGLDVRRAVGFRADLAYEPDDSGFRLRGAGGVVSVRQGSHAVQVGAALAGGALSITQILERSIAARADVLNVRLLLEQLQSQELLEHRGR